MLVQGDSLTAERSLVIGKLLFINFTVHCTESMLVNVLVNVKNIKLIWA